MKLEQIQNCDANETSRVESEDRHWRRILGFLQEAACVIDYLHWRMLCKRYGEQPASQLFQMTADSEGELTEAAVVEQLEAIARQARAGFVSGDGFPVFGALEGRIDNRK